MNFNLTLGDENERQGYYNLIESKIVLHEGPGDFVSRAKANELHHVVRRDGERNKEQGRVEPTVNRSGRARPSAGALTGPQPAHESSYESGHMKVTFLAFHCLLNIT